MKTEELQGSRVILLFVDGLGAGASDPADNPLVRSAYPALERIAGGTSISIDAPAVSTNGSVYRSIDANLGVDGLPQSGTGQATLFTGINCAAIAGRHFGPFPHSSSRPVIREHNLFAEAGSVSGIPAVFANAYPDLFFRYIHRTKRWTVTTLCCTEAGIPLRTESHLRAGTALAADITGQGWPEPAPDHTIISPREAGGRLTRLSENTSLTVFEFFATDKAGHSRDFDRAAEVLTRLDNLIAGILDSLRPDQTLVVTSDHGNIEDLSTKTHTRNPVPLMAWGPSAHHFADVDGLASVKPAILAAIRGDGQ